MLYLLAFLLSGLVCVNSYPIGSPLASCNVGLTTQGNQNPAPLLPPNDPTYVGQTAAPFQVPPNNYQPGITAYPAAGSTVHVGYPNGDNNITFLVTDNAGNTITTYTPGTTYNILMTFNSPTINGMQVNGFAGFHIGAFPALPLMNPVGAGPLKLIGVSVVGGTTFNSSFGQQLACPGVDSHITHTLQLWISHETACAGGTAVKATWTAPLKGIGNIIIQTGLVTGVVNADPSQGFFHTATLIDGSIATTNNAWNWGISIFLLTFFIITFYELYVKCFHLTPCMKNKKEYAAAPSKLNLFSPSKV